MIQYDITNKVLCGAVVPKGETIITVPDGVERIKSLYISGDIRKIVIPSSVKTIDLDAFEYAINLREIVLEDNTAFVIEKKCLFDKEKKTLYLAERDITGRMIVPASVKSISAHAFAHCQRLYHVKLNQAIEYIGPFAFIECFNMETINIPTRHRFELKEATFEGCSELKEITIPSNVVALGKCLFYECWGLEKINIETNQIKTIPAQCFAYCESLIRIDFPEGLIEIQTNAFVGCDEMTEATFPSSVTTIEPSAFLDDKSLTIFSGSKSLEKYCKKNKIMFEKANP